MSDPRSDNNESPRRRPLREIQPTEDPCCSCEPEPRWLRFLDEEEHPDAPSEWESLERPPNEEF